MPPRLTRVSRTLLFLSRCLLIYQCPSMTMKRIGSSLIGIRLVLQIVLSTAVLKSFVRFACFQRIIADNQAEVDSFVAAHGAAMDICEHPSVCLSPL